MITEEFFSHYNPQNPQNPQNLTKTPPTTAQPIPQLLTLTESVKLADAAQPTSAPAPAKTRKRLA